MKKIIYLVSVTLTAFMFSACTQSATEESFDGDSIQIVTSEDLVIENIMSRRSIRQFTNDTIPAAQIEKILRAGFAAPTAMNRQPWAIEVVNDTTLLRQMSTELPYGRLETAAVAFIVLGDMERTIDGDGRDFWVVDCSLMAENMMLAANAMGIGSCFTGVWPGTDRADIIRKHLNIPSKYEVLGMIPMGYPAENPDVKDKWRAEAVHYNAW
ncbi:MAG: nitroreductase family protein [Paludibacteraceae bacterium]|nr:nitroreductase family protein [Paludibacteraceae bacterium]